MADQLAEAVLVHNPRAGKAHAHRRAVELLDLVGIPNAEDRYRSFPHEFSGGMRQRVMIAMAMANDPDVIICDEPTTALDVTIQAQILDLMHEIRSKMQASIILITHDLGVVAEMCERVAVMSEVNMRVSPGPCVPLATPTLPVVIAQPSAMVSAAPSSRASTILTCGYLAIDDHHPTCPSPSSPNSPPANAGM